MNYHHGALLENYRWKIAMKLKVRVKKFALKRDKYYWENTIKKLRTIVELSRAN